MFLHSYVFSYRNSHWTMTIELFLRCWSILVGRSFARRGRLTSRIGLQNRSLRAWGAKHATLLVLRVLGKW